jgi:hypothetical protein
MIKETIENVGNANKNKEALEKEKRKNKILRAGLIGTGVIAVTSFFYSFRLRKENELTEDRCLELEKQLDEMNKKTDEAEERRKNMKNMLTNNKVDSPIDVDNDFQEVTTDGD